MNKYDFNNIKKGFQECIDYINGKKDKGVTKDKFTVYKPKKHLKK